MKSELGLNRQLEVYSKSKWKIENPSKITGHFSHFKEAFIQPTKIGVN